ncbi:DNA helicase [Microbacterium phage AloeVera]|uniref:DNA helicase n=2 Tax=Akonivirus akoni TaxID=2845587 RepID=A0A6M3SZ08_9CAUD|nr:DNA helicase [Microbacterium phage Akoni]QCG78292.1 DNA helicase [Microbacterium phage Akoni]QJD51255.1 DNA helicase [Microbacterium phage Truong]
MPDAAMPRLSWEACEGLFRQADAHLPEGKRFEYWKDSQTSAYKQLKKLPRNRIFLFFPTGEGKSKTALALVASQGYDKCVVLAPLKTHDAWKRDAAVLGLQVKVYTHEMFRQKGTHTPTNVPWIIDEYHKLGGHDGEGFKKWKRLSTKITELVVGASATPNYNKPDRAWCLEVAFDQSPTYGYGDWIYKHCITEPNRFAYYPIIHGFRDFPDVIGYLADKPWIAYIEDTATWTPLTLALTRQDKWWFERYGYSLRHHKIVASQMEKDHKRVNLDFIDEEGLIHGTITDRLSYLMYEHRNEHTHWLIFCAHKDVAEALYKTVQERWEDPDVWLITGDTKDIVPIREQFVAAESGWIICTTAIAEGVDGLDKVCHALLLLDDIVGDNAKRRQIIGRILPRGSADDAERIVVTAEFK